MSVACLFAFQAKWFDSWLKQAAGLDESLSDAAELLHSFVVLQPSVHFSRSYVYLHSRESICIIFREFLKSEVRIRFKLILYLIIG